MSRSAPVNSGDTATHGQYDDLRLDALPASWLEPHKQSTPGMTLYVENGVFWIKTSRTVFAGGNTPTVTAPVTHPRIDLLTIDSSGTLAWVTGTEAISPSVPTYPLDKIVLCEVYNRVGETKLLDADDSSNGYIQNDVRPFIQNKISIDQDSQAIYAADTGSANTLVIALNPAITAYKAGQVFRVKVANATTGASTLNVNSLGAKTIKKNGGSADIASNDLLAGQLATFQYDGTYMQLISPVAGTGAALAVKIATYDMTTVSGNQTIAHGLGTTPSRVEIEALAGVSAKQAIAVSKGVYLNGNHSCIATVFAGTNANYNNNSTSYDVYCRPDNNVTENSVTGVISVDATNVTIAWTKLNAPTGTLLMLLKIYV